MSADLPLHVLRSGAGERIIFLHGSGDTGAAAFAAQQPLAEDFELWMVDRRGFGQSAGAGRVDWAQDARDLLRLLDEPTHLVGHSYGTIACLLAAAEAPAQVRSLTLIEPSAYGLARDDPDVADLVPRLAELYARAPGLTPAGYFEGMAVAFGYLEGPLPQPMSLPADRAAAIDPSRTERPPWEAEIPLDAIARARVPTQLVMGGWDAAPAKARARLGAALEAVAAVLERELKALRTTIPGTDHWPHRDAERFNPPLAAFVRRCSDELRGASGLGR